MLARIVFVSSLVTLAGCASVKVPEATHQTGHYPGLGEHTVVNVGQVMVAEFDFLARTTATALATVASSFWAGRRGVATGDTLVMAIAGGDTVYCLPPLGLYAPCVKDVHGTGEWTWAGTMNAYQRVVSGRRIPPTPYRLTSQSMLDGHKYELIYQGIDAGVVRIAYREYTETLARPAFSQDLTYTVDADGSARVRFRDVDISIHSADNSEIAYTVIAGFSTSRW